MDLVLCFHYDPQAMGFATAREGKDTNSPILHCLSSLKLLLRYMLDFLPLNNHVLWLLFTDTVQVSQDFLSFNRSLFSSTQYILFLNLTSSRSYRQEAVL
jgi:hypothetical protein